MSFFTHTEGEERANPFFVTVCGPSGVGKTSFVNSLVQRMPERFARVISFTTRPRRDGEGDHEYTFVSRGRILKILPRQVTC